MTSFASRICSTLSPRRRRKKKITPLESAMIYNLKQSCFHISKLNETGQVYFHRCSAGEYIKGAEFCLRAMKNKTTRFSKYNIDNYDMKIRYICYIMTCRLENEKKSKLASKYLKALNKKKY